jgi:L-aminopeptidase/D-esterase-like protein
MFNDGLALGAVAAVNAFGDILDPSTGKIIAGSLDPNNPGKFLGTAKAVSEAAQDRPFSPENTSLAVICTNATLGKGQAEKIAQMAQIGLAKTISPCHATVDGDVIFVLATCEWGGPVSINRLGILAAESLAEAIVRAVKKAEPMDGLPAWKTIK